MNTRRRDQDLTDHHSPRPVERTSHRGLARALLGVRSILGGDRLKNLVTEMSAEVSGIKNLIGKNVRLLDYGCGNMDLSERLQQLDLLSNLVCVDTYPAPEARGEAVAMRYSKYRSINSDVLPFDNDSFDAAIVVDVLHHVGIEKCRELLRELARCCKYVIVKDHFEYGYLSRQRLRLADWNGNFAYGVSIPDRYFSVTTWQETLLSAGLRELNQRRNVKVHDGVYGIILPASHHFISILSKPKLPA